MSLPDYYDILDVEQDASLAEIINAYRIAISAFGAGSRAAYSMYEDDQLQAIREQIEHAYKVLSHPEKRRAYDDLLSGGDEALGGVKLDSNVVYLAGKEPSRNGDVRYSGAHMRTIRKSRCISLQQISELTGIGSRQVQAIEEEDVSFFGDPEMLAEQLSVYAREIGCDPERVVATYPLLTRKEYR